MPRPVHVFLSTWSMEEQPCCSNALLSGSTTPSYSATGTSTISGEDYDTDTESEETGTVASLLDRLKSATAADIARPRKTKRNDPPRGKRRCKGAVSSDPKGVTPQQRVREFTNESLTVSQVHLFCTACRERLSIKRSIIKNHVQSTKHKKSQQRLKNKETRERDIAESLRKYNNDVHSRGESLPKEQQVYRIKVVSTFLKAGVPLSKMDSFRDLLEENAFRLTDRRNMQDYVPFILKEEEARIRSEISGQQLSVIFDGTSRLGEALAVIFRFVDSDWKVQQRLVRMQMLSKSLAGEEIARELITVLSVNYSVRPDHLLAAMRDRASTNNVAMHTLKIVYPVVVDIGCFSHTIDHVGSHFSTPTLNDFISLWISLFSHSPKTRLLWKCRTERSMSRYSATRWWSKWEVVKQVMLYFGDIQPFLEENDDIGAALRPKLLSYLQIPQTNSKLQVEIAATVDWGEPFVKACYDLEGDGPLALQCYDRVDRVLASIATENIPNVRAVVEKLTKQPPSHPHHEQWITYARNCVKDGIKYFKHQLETNLKTPLQIFKCCRLFSPQKVREMIPTSLSVNESLTCVPFFDNNERQHLLNELPTYLSEAADVDRDFDQLHWWRLHATTLPHWSAAAKKMILIQPSSAAAERVFSLLKVSFGEQQEMALQDYVEASIMLQYNKR